VFRNLTPALIATAALDAAARPQVRTLCRVEEAPAVKSHRKVADQCRYVLPMLAVASSLGFLLPTSGWAQSPAPAPAAQAAQRNAASFSVSEDTVITVRADKTAQLVETRRAKILGSGAIQSEGQQSINYVEGMETLDIEAYTEKPDGTKVPVDPASILTRDAASGLAATYERDLKVRTVIFRDIAVGDTLVLISRREEKSGMFPGHFNSLQLFPLQLPYADSTTLIVAPKELALNVTVYGEQMDHRVTSDQTTTRHVIAYHPRRRAMTEAGATSILDRDPRIIVSTFDTYEQLGRSYWAAMEAKAKPTAEIKKLADQITKGIADKRAQAEAIDRWIKHNIRYVAVFLGTGRVVANDPATVLMNKYGDCKDHATLMTALLAAKGIASEQVLINLGDVYTLPETVTASYFNHAMLYLPELALYDDPTASLASFGVLPRQSYDKPVLHMSAKGAHLAHTPAMRAAEHVTTNHTRIAIAANGTVTGETRDTATGASATEVRAAAISFQSIGLETAGERILQSRNNAGKGVYEIGSPADAAPAYEISGKFVLNGRLNVTPGSVLAIPLGMNVLVRPGEFLLGARLPNRQNPFVCFAGRQVEDIEVSFAEGLPLPTAPKGIKIDNPQFTYVSDYRLEYRTLKITREFESRVAGEVCAPESEAAIADPLKAVQADLGTGMRIDTPKPVKTETLMPEAKAEPRKLAPTDPQLLSRSHCAGADNAAADLRIGGCTAVIQSGQEAPAALAVDFYNRALAYRMKGDHAHAIEDFDQAIKLVPNYAFAFNGRGASRHAMRDYDQAIADFDEAIRLSPLFSNAFANRGNAHWDRGARDAAMADYEQATRLDPVNASAFLSRGRALRVAGEYDRAIDDFDQMIRIQKTNASAWNERCYTHVVAGTALPAAVTDCSESIKLNANNSAALGNRGLALLKLNELDRAIADYDAALRLAPKYALALYGRGLAKLKKDDTEGGNADIAAAKVLNADVAKEFAKFGLAVVTQSDTPAKSVL
jgi:tetratricopeptide (TPR) repeat protein